MSKESDVHTAKNETEASGNRPCDGECPVLVVGVGASASGLKSLRQLFAREVLGHGVAFVLIQHTEPSRGGLIIKELGQRTAFAVVEAVDGMSVLADRIHVMPTDKFLNITGSRLTLQEPVFCDGLWMPIDHFFCSLAVDQGRRGCGILLPGTGNDGVLGMSEIKSKGGRTFMEKSGRAKLSDVKQSAVDTGIMDAVLSAKHSAKAIIELAEQVAEETRNEPAESPEFDADIRAALEIVRIKASHDFRCYKPTTLIRRIRRRMTLAKVSTFADYVRILHEHPKEVELLKKDLLIGVTEFFRQPRAWEVLGEKVIAGLAKRVQPESEIRAWVPGCSTGKEAYSLAMLLSEQLEHSENKAGFQIFATDSDVTSLAKARKGSYSEEDLGPNVSVERRKRFFMYRDGRYHVNKEIRERIVFAPQNLTADPPFSRLDLISCRNLLIYLDQQIQQKIFALFHFALREGGFLFLGTAETVGDREDLFEPVSKKWRIYRRIGIGRQTSIEIPFRPTGESLPVPGRLPAVGSTPRLSLASMAEQMLLDRFAPACVMIDRRLQVLYVHGAVDHYLTFPPGELTTQVVDMAREGLRARLRGAIGKCIELGRTVSVKARVRRGEKSTPVKATVSPLRHSRETDGLLLITFEDYRIPSRSQRQASGDSDIRQLEDELKVTREELQSTIEQLESSIDQLKASNEEVTASNEELQSANEELETSKEELQSLNEELNTINIRLQEKVGELESTNNDVVNLLSSTNIATLFLDKELKVKRYTPAITQLLSLIPSDMGRPVADILCRFSDEHLLDDAYRVLAELTPLSKEVQGQDARWYIRRITPYRTQDDRIEGVVVTFMDITELKQTEQNLRESKERFRAVVEQAAIGIEQLDLDGRIIAANPMIMRILGYTEGELQRKTFEELTHVDDLHRERELVNKLLAGELPSYTIEKRYLRKDGSPVWGRVTSSLTKDVTGRPLSRISIVEDITERKEAEEALHKAHDELEMRVRERTRELTEANAMLEAEIAERRRAEEAVKTERQRLNDVLDMLPAYVVLLTQDYQVPFVNRFFRERFGESGGRRCFEWLFGRTEPCEICETYTVLKTNAPHHWEWTGPDGRNYDIFDFPFKDADGSPLIMEVGIDITELKRAEASLRDANETLERRVLERTAELRSVNARLQVEIAERRQAEEAARVAHGRTVDILESIGDGFFSLDREWRVTYVNEKGANMIGKSREELLGRSIWESYSEAVGSGFYRAYHRTMSERVATNVEEFYPPLNAWFESYAYPSPEGVSVFYRNVSARKLVEERLRESEEDLNRAQTVAHTGSWRLNVRQNVLKWSNEAYRIFGIPSGMPMNYEAFLASIHPEDREYVDSAWKAALQGKPYDIEHRIVVDGQVKWVREKAELELDAAGALLGGFGTVQDVTEHKQAEQALRESEARFRVLSETAGRLLGSKDPQGIVNELCRQVMANLDCQTFFNYLVEEETGRLHLNACAGIPEGEIHKIEWLDYGVEVRRCATRDGVVADDSRNAPDPHTELLKSYGIHAYACHPLMAQGRIIGTLSFGRKSQTRFSSQHLDLMKTVTDQVATAMERIRLIRELQESRDELETRVRERTAQLQKSNEALAQSNRDLEDFAHVASHDLQEPLRKIQTFSDKLLTVSRDSLDDNARDYLERMQRAAGRMQALILDLLRYSRISSKPEPFTRFNLREPAEETVLDLRVLREETGGQVEIGELPEIEADRVQMRQLFQNLIGNGLKYHGELKPVVKVHSRPSNSGFWEILIEDNGIGFDQSYLDKIFRPFQRLHGRSAPYQGTGMGLAICRRIVERHGGTITAESKPGEGSTFIVKLPRKNIRQGKRH